MNGNTANGGVHELSVQVLVRQQHALAWIGSRTGHCGWEIPRLLGEILQSLPASAGALGPPAVAMSCGRAPSSLGAFALRSWAMDLGPCQESAGFARGL